MVTIKFFAVLKKMSGREDYRLSIHQPMPLKQIFDQIEMEIPHFRNIMKEGRALVAINHEMADENSIVHDGDEIALLPPFAGGSGIRSDS